MSLRSSVGRDSSLEEQKSLPQIVVDALMCGCPQQENIKVELHPASEAAIIILKAADETGPVSAPSKALDSSSHRDHSNRRDQSISHGIIRLCLSRTTREDTLASAKYKAKQLRPKRANASSILLSMQLQQN
ncbi:hypothetical protein Nepgr_002684 [Nepenthes gracilis]|uniref:Uncharacterized protein n=1 Tax=Nepenthes gracilis TaxID=150966 RepID=A0AAD3RYK0_NEPGR|nr:hypothetical protein Nepgr_002684 [Nepenthes gracilis]